MQNKIEINGIKYTVLGQREFTHNGEKRIELSMQRPNGRKIYHAVVYKNGTVSEAI